MQDATIQAVFDAAANLISLAGSLHRCIKRGEEMSMNEVLAVAAGLRARAAILEKTVGGQSTAGTASQTAGSV